MCDHFHESTSRYDHDAKLLTLLLFCPSCGIEQVVETLEYEPRYRPCLIAAPGRSTFADVATTEPEPLLLAA